MNEDTSYYQKQDPAKPLFEDLIWAKPENKKQAGKLLIVGGNLHSFKQVNEAYTEALKVGIGTCNLLLPNALEKLLSKILVGANFAPSTSSGSFARSALAQLSELADCSDGVLLAGELGKNSETAILFESFIEHYDGLLTYVNDALDLILTNPVPILNRPNTIVIASMSQLQKLGTAAKFPAAFTSSMDIIRLTKLMHEFCAKYPLSIVTYHSGHIFVAANNKVSTTKKELIGDWTTLLAADASVWTLQNKTKIYEALSSSFI